MKIKFLVYGLTAAFLSVPVVAQETDAKAEEGKGEIVARVIGKGNPTESYMKYIMQKQQLAVKGGPGKGKQAAPAPEEGNGEDPKKKKMTYQEKLDRANRTMETIQNTSITIGNITNVGKKIYDIVKDNNGVIQTEDQVSNGIPQGLEDEWESMEGWSMRPNSVSYEIKDTKWYGSTKFHVVFNVMYTYGGSYRGQGRYLTGVTVQPVQVYVSDGYVLNIKCQIPDSALTNIGTNENPIAQMKLKLVVELSGSSKERFLSEFIIDGKGNFTEETVDHAKQTSKKVSTVR